MGNVYYEEAELPPPFYEDIEEYKMSNHPEFLNDLELEDRLGSMNDRELMEFTARQTYDVCNLALTLERRVILLERRGNRFIAIVGAAGAFVGAIVLAIINYFAGKQ